MEARRYIIFDAISTGPGEGDFSFGPTAVDEPLDTLLRVETISPLDATGERQKPGRVVAEPMPTQLVAPVATADTDVPTGPGAAWGVQATGAADSPFSGHGVKVAILDTGIDAKHPAFQGVQITEQDFTGDGNGDEVGHGTHCAGTILGREVNGFRFSIAPGVDELLVGKVLGPKGGTTEGLVNGIIWALQSGANVISMSLGFDFPGAVADMVAKGVPPQPATSQALQAYRDNLRLFGSLASFMQASNPFGRPALVVAASGNESEREAQTPYTIDVSPPAASEGFIAVAAIQQGANGGFGIARFSNTGATVAGPGVDILSAKAGGGYTTMSGTSMATPHLAGLAALWAESILKNAGQLDATIMRSRLIAAGQLGGLSTGDVGAGFVKAPMA